MPDYNALRDYVVNELEGGKAGSRFPTFILHSDCDGEWAVLDCEKLRSELSEIAVALKVRPAVAFASDWQKVVAKSIGLVPENAFESFIDVDGEFLNRAFARLSGCCIEATAAHFISVETPSRWREQRRTPTLVHYRTRSPPARSVARVGHMPRRSGFPAVGIE